MKRISVVLSLAAMVIFFSTSATFAGGWLAGTITKVIQVTAEVQLEVERASDLQKFTKIVEATNEKRILAMALTLYTTGDACEVHYNNSNQWDGIRMTMP